MSKVKTNPRAIKDTIEVIDKCNLSDTKKAIVNKCLEKQYPSGIKIKYNNYICPKCNFIMTIYPNKYCSNCGQRLFEHNYNNEKRRYEYKWNIVIDNDENNEELNNND